MKPGNLLIQGAKSGGKREMRIRYYAHRVHRCAVFYVIATPYPLPRGEGAPKGWERNGDRAEMGRSLQIGGNFRLMPAFLFRPR